MFKKIWIWLRSLFKKKRFVFNIPTELKAPEFKDKEAEKAAYAVAITALIENNSLMGNE